MEKLTFVCVSDALYVQAKLELDAEMDRYKRKIKQLWDNPIEIINPFNFNRHLAEASMMYSLATLWFVSNCFFEGIVYVRTQDAKTAFKEAYNDEIKDGGYYIVHPKDDRTLIPAEKFLFYLEEEKLREIVNYICKKSHPKHITIKKSKATNMGEKVNVKENYKGSGIDIGISEDDSDSVKIMYDQNVENYKIKKINYRWIKYYQVLTDAVTLNTNFKISILDNKSYKLDSAINLKSKQVSVFNGYNKTYKVNESLEIEVNY